MLLSRRAHGHAARLQILHPLRRARVPTIVLLSRGFSCCCTSQPPQGYYPPCVQPRLHHRRVPTMVWHSTPPCCTGGGWRLMPTGLSLCLAIGAGLQPAHRAQGPVPISSWPMRLHRSLLTSSTVFVSPMQSALTAGQSTDRWFSCLYYWSPTG